MVYTCRDILRAAPWWRGLFHFSDVMTIFARLSKMGSWLPTFPGLRQDNKELLLQKLEEIFKATIEYRTALDGRMMV